MLSINQAEQSKVLILRSLTPPARKGVLKETEHTHIIYNIIVLMHFGFSTVRWSQGIIMRSA